MSAVAIDVTPPHVIGSMSYLWYGYIPTSLVMSELRISGLEGEKGQKFTLEYLLGQVF